METPKSAKKIRVLCNTQFKKAGFSKNPALASQNIDKNLAKRARKSAAMPEDKFAVSVADAVGLAVAAAEGDKEVIRAAKERRHTEKKKRRQAREKELAIKIKALPEWKYGVIVKRARDA